MTRENGDDIEQAAQSTESPPVSPVPSPRPPVKATISIEPPTNEVKQVSLSSSNNMKAISACSLYSFCSVSMILVNKSLASRYVPFLAREAKSRVVVLLFCESE